MEKSLLVIVRHKPGRTRLLMRALQSINDQTFKKINIIIFCMEEELKCHNVDDFYLKELSNIYSVIYDENFIFNAIKMLLRCLNLIIYALWMMTIPGPLNMCQGYSVFWRIYSQCIHL